MWNESSPNLSPKTEATFLRVKEWLGSRLVSTRRAIVGVGGAGGCGKSTLCRWLVDNLDGSAVLHLDDFRLPRNDRPNHALFGSHPDANDLNRLSESLDRFRRSGKVVQPVFDAVAGKVLHETVGGPAKLLFADGEIAAHQGVRAQFDLFILVNAHWRTQLDTRISRDIQQREYSVDRAITVFLQSNLRDFPRFSAGANEEADLVLYRARNHQFSLRKSGEASRSNLNTKL